MEDPIHGAVRAEVLPLNELVECGIKIDLPTTFPFSITIPVRITDINYGQHVGNDALLGLVHEARMQFLAQHKLSEIDVGGCGLIMRNAMIEFRAQGFYGDQIQIDVVAVRGSKTTFDFIYRLAHADSQKEIARVKTGMACFDYERQKVCKISRAIQDLLVDA